MPYINDRWLGGTLTNFRTIRSRLTRLEELERIREIGRNQHLLQENAVVAQSRIQQDVSEPQWHADDESACLSA